MSTVIRPELSENSKYYIPKHRYYELKHYCLQYGDMKKEYSDTSYLSSTSVSKTTQSYKISDNTAKTAIKTANLVKKISMIEDVAMETDPIIGKYILKAVTTGCSYDYLKINFNIPCSKDLYYDRYRRFFWLLDKEKE